MLRFQDLEFTSGKVYKDRSGIKWTLSCYGNHFYSEEKAMYLSEYYNEKSLTKMTFEEVIAWNHVPVDTPILVQNEGDVYWYKRHFAKIDNDGKVYTFPNGTTSFSYGDTLGTTSDHTIPWDIAKLAKTVD